ncbi:protease HtpX [Granulosicoccaceae sp. 1_MG-2023]|nr:protease HtpX [Granulosicoccaceae sp. 1_MG-2023]
MTRIILFLATNFAVMIVFGIVVRLFGIDQMVGMPGQMTQLLVFAALFGFAGSFISLAMSKMMAKRSMGVQIIEQPANETERWLVQTVQQQAQAAGIGMPEVGVFHSATPNAFATGMNKNAALVAVSTGLLENMNKNEVEAVLGHEVSHVANGDMVTMGLIQGVLNTFVIFFARVLGMLIDRGMNRDGNGHGMGYWIGSIAGEIVFGILASIIAAWFSRQREFRADRGGAQLSSTSNMIGALRALQRVSHPEGLPDKMAAFGILGGGKLSQLMATHPPLETRIEALQRGNDG